MDTGWSGLPFLSPGDLPNPGIEPASPDLAVGFFTTESPGKSQTCTLHVHINTVGIYQNGI